jgi:GNAT superfamily N-acetyltransferase
MESSVDYLLRGKSLMSSIAIRQADLGDTSIIEDILLDVVQWLDSNNMHQWERKNVLWEHLQQFYRVDDFCLAYSEKNPVGCMALTDYDPVFWPDIPRGKSLFIHKMGVKRIARGKGVFDALIGYAKDSCIKRGIPWIHIDCHQSRTKVRALYEKHGFRCVAETLLGDYSTALYSYNMNHSAEEYGGTHRLLQ